MARLEDRNGETNWFELTSGGETQFIDEDGNTTFTLGTTPNTLTLTAVPTSSTFGVSVAFTATISPSGPTGVVTFTDGGTAFGSLSISGTTAVVSTSLLSVGTHSIVANYAEMRPTSPVLPTHSAMLLALELHRQ